MTQNGLISCCYCGTYKRSVGLEIDRLENITDPEPTGYISSQNHLIKILSINNDAIQQDLAKIITRYASLPEHIKKAIIILLGTKKV